MTLPTLPLPVAAALGAAGSGAAGSGAAGSGAANSGAANSGAAGSGAVGRPPADPEQEFVSRLRSSAPLFAAAAGAQSAVVCEAVPPARHRRSRCRVVLRFPDGGEADVTFVGPADQLAPAEATRAGFDATIERWLHEGRTDLAGAGNARWLVPDASAAAGTAVDVTAWLAALPVPDQPHPGAERHAPQVGPAHRSSSGSVSESAPRASRTTMPASPPL